MLPGPIEIRKCEKCGGLIEEETVLSCNDCGAIGWTDGYFVAPMWPDQPKLVKCPHCKAILWIEDQETVGEREGPGTVFDRRLKTRQKGLPGILDPAGEAGGVGNMDLSGAEPYVELNRWDYFKFIGNGGLDDGRMRYVRVRAWHWGNHVRRRCSQDRSLFRRKKGWRPPPLSARERANLEALLPLLDESDDNARILKAEAVREIGRFAEALRILEKPFEEGLMGVADIVRELAMKRNAMVREIKRTDG